MRQKLKLLGKAGKAGGTWARDTTDHFGRVLTFYALLIGSGGVSAVQVGWWGPLAALAIFALIAFCAGVLTAWEKAEDRVALEERFQVAIRSLEKRCYDHITKVERILAARSAAAPVSETELARALRDAGSPESRRQRAEAEQHERETVAAFIESDHLDRGIGLIDYLIEWEFVNPATRKNVAEPKTRHDIEDGLLSIRWGAEHMPVYR